MIDALRSRLERKNIVTDDIVAVQITRGGACINIPRTHCHCGKKITFENSNTFKCICGYRWRKAVKVQ